MSSFVVAIDGPAGAGKSTLAQRLAARFGLLNLESGAMYRAFALKALTSGVSLEDERALKALSGSTQIVLEPASEGNRVLLDGEEVTARIRQQDVTDAASRVSVHPSIRTWLVGLQRSIGQQGRVVMEGRDIGTAVFPQANVKIFLDADPEIRGQRRWEQNGATRGKLPEAVLQEIRERDQRDRTRASSPLVPATDAVILDSTALTLEEVVERAAALVTERLAQTRSR